MPRHRGSILSLLVVVLALVAPPSGQAAAPAASLPAGQFSIAVIPDTQQEVFGADQRFAGRTQWLVDNRAALNLAFVMHTGDMMNWDPPDHAQYAIGRAAMQRLTTGWEKFVMIRL